MICAMIPARAGSERLKNKNLLEINKRSVISYGIQLAFQANCFNRVIVNSDSLNFKRIAEENGAEFYHRKSDLGKSQSTSDEVVNDFFNKFTEVEILVWINSISPLQKALDIRNALTYFNKVKADSLISSYKSYRHGIVSGKPINFETNSGFARTQDLEPVELLTYSFMIWRRNSFLSSYSKTRSGIMNGKFVTFPVDFLSSLAIKDQSDFDLIKLIAESFK
jgi:CMP-N-acetylneuraminic acid synthetase